MRSRPRDVPEDNADADAHDDDSDRAPDPPPPVGESGGDATAVALHGPQNSPGRLSLKLPLRFGDSRFDGLDTSMPAILWPPRRCGRASW